MNPLPCAALQLQGNCSICREELHSETLDGKRTISSINPCGHLFHTDCIYRWSTEHITCPMGRRVIESLQLQLPLPSGWQNLMINSARNGEYDKVLALLKRGAPVDANCSYHHTPFAIAASKRHFSVARLLADHGSSDSAGQLCMGNMLFEGSGVEKDQAHAFKWYTKAADQGLAPAQFRLAMMYWFGTGVPSDKMLAVDWLKKVVAQGVPHAQATLGEIYLLNDTPVTDVPQGLQLLNKAIQGGSLRGMQLLGSLYLRGEHVNVDLPKARQLLEQAAKRNYLPAKTSLAEYYLKLNRTENLPQIITQLQSGVDQQYWDAMYLLGTVYRDHLRDPIRALELFRQAAEKEDKNSHFELGHMYETGQGVPKDPGQAYVHFHKAAMRGHSNAQFRLGLMYLRGKYTSKDLCRARYFLGKAAEKGHKEATERLKHIKHLAPHPDSVATPVTPDKKTKPIKRLQRKTKRL